MLQLYSRVIRALISFNQKYKSVRQKLDKVAPAKQEQFEQQHSADLALFDAAAR